MENEKNPIEYNTMQSAMDYIKDFESRKDMRMLSRILETGKPAVITHKALGAISVDAGHTGKNGYGLKHIIEQRYTKEGIQKDDITAVLYLVKEAAEKGIVAREITREAEGKTVGSYDLEKDGIIAFVSKTRGTKNEKFIITGFSANDKKREATDAIQAVIAQYGYAPEFSGVRKQVGAVIASIPVVSHGKMEKSRADLPSNKASKEAIMAEEKTEAQTGEKRKSYLVQNSEKIVESLEKGTAPFLPGKAGVIHAEPVRSADTGKMFNGMNQVLMQMYLKEGGYNDKTVCTFEQAKKAGTHIKAGAQSFPITLYDAETKESKVYHYFPASEAGDKSKFQTPDRIVKDQVKAPAIECKDTEPAKYLGKYLAAVYLETDFKADPKVQKEFQKNMLAEIRSAENQITKPFEIGNRATKECKELVSGISKEAWVQARRQEREQERSQARGGQQKQAAKAIER
jgi:hypothetical protein